MANSTSKPPKHDFAPAWLKVPDKEASRKSGNKVTDDKCMRANRRDDYYNGYNRHDYYSNLQRQHSFDYYEDRRYSPQKYRHHSVDDDYYNGGYGCYGGAPGAYYDGYYDKYGGSHYRSYPGGLYADSKYTHPNARFGSVHPAPSQPGGYPPQYYDPYMHDYYHGDAYYGSYMRPGGNGGKRRPLGAEKDIRRTGRGEKRPDSRSKENSVDDDFPCLSGDVAGEKKSGRSSALSSPVGAWANKIPAAKVVNGNASDAGSQGQRMETGEQFTSLNKKTASNSESGVLKAPMEKLLKPVPASIKDINSNSERAINASTKSMSVTSKDVDSIDENSQNDDLATVVVAAAAQNGELSGELAHSLHDLSISTVERNLMSSSSIEAEQRLLKQMGWDEGDDEDYVITEDELREFQKLKQMNPGGGRNGLARSLAPVWSPQHLAPGPVPLEESPCSSSDDSDLD